MVHTSPRLPDDLEYEEDGDDSRLDPRMRASFRPLSLESADFLTYHRDDRPFAGTPNPGKTRRKKKERESLGLLERAAPFQYRTKADGNVFRLAVVKPGTGTDTIRCELLLRDVREPPKHYRCLSYAWESDVQDAAILVDGYKFDVTKNLFRALQCLRKPKTTLLLWIDQICINQTDHEERGRQVKIMRHIFNQAQKVYVWLGEAADGSERLFQYAEKMRDSPRVSHNRVLGQRDLHHAIQKLLERSWFQRVWVIPEVVLSRHTAVVCGSSRLTWDALVKLIKEVQPPQASGFVKHASLLGNPRQRMAIVKQMIASQKESRAHTDITQLLILGKGSQATDVRDKVYAFYGLTYLTTEPDYTWHPERLFVEIVHMYTSNLLWIDAYANEHGLTEGRRTFQLMSILYSAGALHQDEKLGLPSWVPDWTCAWDLAPVWCKSIPNFVPTSGSGKDEWSTGIRSDYRAGGHMHLGKDFEVLDDNRRLRVSAHVFDKINLVNELTPASTPQTNQFFSSSPVNQWDLLDTGALQFGRHFFTTETGQAGFATPGIVEGDEVAIILGGDVPVVVRRRPELEFGDSPVYQLLCECYVRSPAVMYGEMISTDWPLAKEIVFI